MSLFKQRMETWMGSILVKSYLIPKQFCFTLLGCFYTRKWKFRTGHWQGHNSYPLRCSDISGETSSLYSCLMSIKKKSVVFLYFFTLLRANRKCKSTFHIFIFSRSTIFFSQWRRDENQLPPLSQANTFSWTSFSMIHEVHRFPPTSPPSLCILQGYLDWLQHFLLSQPAVRVDVFPEQLGASGSEV